MLSVCRSGGQHRSVLPPDDGVMTVNIPRVIGESTDTPANTDLGLARSVANFAALVEVATLQSGSYRLEIRLGTVLSGFVKPYGQAIKLPRQLATRWNNW